MTARMRTDICLPAALSMRSRLRLSCGAAALAAAVAIASPQQAKAQAFQGNEAVVAGSATRTITSTTSETITIGSPTATINWSPYDTSGTGTVDFLPSGHTATFTNDPASTADFTVLNRILPLDPSRPISLNGHVISQLQDFSGNVVRGGNVWFYSPGGIMIGATAVFDVGGLLLSVNDPVSFATSAGGFSGRFTGSSTGNAQVNIASGAQINALAHNSYVALVAPRVVQDGSIRVDGAAALVAAQDVSLTMDQGLFDIQVHVGTDDPNGGVHTGSTGGPSSSGPGDNHRVYMVAVPKNNALTMLLSGNVGFDTASSASLENGAIVLSAGYGIENSHAPDIFTGAFLGSAFDGLPANIQIAGGNFSSPVTGEATGNIEANGAGGALNFAGDVSLQALGSSTLIARSGETVTVGGSASITADDNKSFSVANEAVSHPLDAQGGTATIRAEAGGAITIAGVATVSADAQAADDFIRRTGGSAVAGTATMIATGGGSITANGVELSASGWGSHNRGGGDGVSGSGTGGSVQLTAESGGEIAVNGNLAAYANGGGGLILDAATAGGTGTGGNVTIRADGGSIDVTGNLEAIANGYGGSAPFSGGVQTGGNGQGGSASVHSTNAGSISLGGTTDVWARAHGGNAHTGGNGTGGFASVSANSRGMLVLAGETTITADATGGSGTDGQGGAGAGGGSELRAYDDSSVTASSVTATSHGTGGDGSAGGSGRGGTAYLSAHGGSRLQIGTATAASNGTGGDGAAGGLGGTGSGGAAEIFTIGGSTSVDVALIEANGTGGNGGTGGAGTGGSIAAGSRDGQFSATSLTGHADGLGGTGLTGNGGAGSGGQVLLAANLQPDTTIAATSTLSTATLTADGTGGAGGSSGTGTGTGGAGGDGTGGTIRVLGATATGTLSIQQLAAQANGAGGAGGDGSTGGAGGNGQGGTVTLRAHNYLAGTPASGSVTVGTAILAANGAGGAAGAGSSTGGTAGQGVGGSAGLQLTGSALNATNVTLMANGTTTGGTSSVDLQPSSDGTVHSILQLDSLSASANGGTSAGEVLISVAAGSSADIGDAELHAEGADSEGGITIDLAESPAGGASLQAADLTAVTSGDISIFSLSPEVLQVGGTLNGQAGGDLSIGGVTAGTAALLSAGGTASLSGTIAAPQIRIASAALDIAEGAQLGVPGLTGSLELIARTSGQPIIIGGSDESGTAEGQYHLTQAEAERIEASAVTFRATSTNAQSPQVVVRDLTIQGSAGGGVSSVQLITSGAVRVEGDLAYIDAAASDALTITAGERLEVITPDGSIRMVAPDGGLGGILTLQSSNIVVTDAALAARLADDPEFAGRNEALATNNGPVNQAGYLEADGIQLLTNGNIFIQNSGTSTEFAGMTAGGQGLLVGRYQASTNPDGTQSFSFVGTLTTADDVLLFDFTITSQTQITLRTYSYAGGVNGAGETIPAGGFDPILALFDAAGTLIDQNDDGGSNVPADPTTGRHYDTFLEAMLPAGTYTVAVTAFSNFPAGTNLSDGFDGGGNFNGRTPNFAFDVIGADLATGPGDTGPITVVAFGRMQNADGSFTTGDSFFAASDFGLDSGVEYAQGSTFNGCAIGGSCPVVQVPTQTAPPPGTDPQTVLGPIELIISDTAVGPEDESDASGTGISTSTSLVNTGPGVLEGLLDEAVTSGGDTAQWIDDNEDDCAPGDQRQQCQERTN